MSKNTKKKTDRYIKFQNSTNSINYNNKKVIIDQFNKSVRKYKRFKDLLSGGDEEMASSKLHDAGTDLYMCCEWAIKNYLHRRYDEQYSNHEIPSHARDYKINQLSTKDATIFYLLNELEDVGTPSMAEVGIKREKISGNVQEVSNAPKHVRTIPDPNLYKISLGEIRKIIKNYVDENAELDVIDDSIYGDDKGWYEILEETSEFNRAYSYVLITRRIELQDIEGLFSMKWDLVIDMDPDSDVDGFAKKYANATGIVPRVRTLDFKNCRKAFSFSHIPYWIMANGTSDIPDSVVETRKWSSVHGKYLTNVLEEFQKEYSKHVKAFVYPIENEIVLRKIVEAFNDVYDGGDEVDFLCYLQAMNIVLLIMKILEYLH